MSNQLLDFQPRDLKFSFEVKKQSSCSVQIFNLTDFLVAYKVKTTSPKKYCVRPNVGIVKPKSSCDIVVTMQGQKVAPPGLICKDKFLVQSTIVPDGTTDDNITSSTFVKDDGKHVEYSKLRVVLVNPPLSAELPSEKGASNHMPAPGATLPKDHVSDGIDITSQQKDKNLEDTNLHKPHIIEAITSPGKKITRFEIIEDLGIQNFKDSRNINVPHKEITQDMGLQKHMTSEEVNAWKNKLVGDVGIQKDNTIEETTPSTIHGSDDKGLQKHRTSRDIKWKNDTTGDISMQKESTITRIILPTTHNAGNIIPYSEVASTAPESVPGNNEVGAVAIKIGMKKDVTNFDLVKDIETLNSKLNGLESKLREAEITISKLAKERRLSSGELENLRKEAASKSTAIARESGQVGFPFLYVVVVAFISVVLGYRCGSIYQGI